MPCKISKLFVNMVFFSHTVYEGKCMYTKVEHYHNIRAYAPTQQKKEEKWVIGLKRQAILVRHIRGIRSKRRRRRRGKSRRRRIPSSNVPNWIRKISLSASKNKTADTFTKTRTIETVTQQSIIKPEQRHRSTWTHDDTQPKSEQHDNIVH